MGRPSSTSAMQTQNSGMCWVNSFVPSSGSTIHTRDAAAELGDGLGKPLRPVERIDDPHAPLRETRLRVGRLLGEPAVVGKGLRDDRVDAGVRLAIGGGERVIVALSLALEV